MDASIEFFKLFIEIGLVIFFWWLVTAVFIMAIDGIRWTNKIFKKRIWKYFEKIKRSIRSNSECTFYISALIKEINTNNIADRKIILKCCEVVYNGNYEPQEDTFILEILDNQQFFFKKGQRIYIEYWNGQCLCNGEIIYGINPYLIDKNEDRIFWVKE